MTGLAIVLGTGVSYGLAWVAGVPALVPVLNTLASFPFMVLALGQCDVRLAIARMLLWAATMGACATMLSYAQPARTDALFLRAAPYRAEMFAWVRTGRGAESTPSQFIPDQARQTALFGALALATGGTLAMPIGAVLMNYMGHYVGMLAATSAHPALTMVLGWHPWAVIRVVSFVVIGVVLSVPLLSRLGGFRIEWRAVRAFLFLAAGGLLLDIVLKAALAPAWQRLLLRVVGW